MAKSWTIDALMADAFRRLGNTVLMEAPARARQAYERSRVLYEAVGDARGLVGAYSNLGIAAQFEAKLDEAQQAFARGMSAARTAGIADFWGLSALNLGVLSQKCGDYDRARELFGEALALFAAVKHSEYQLVALYNMAHVERELGLWESASELYDATIPLAQRIGKSDIEIGAIVRRWALLPRAGTTRRCPQARCKCDRTARNPTALVPGTRDFGGVADSP